MSDWQPIAAFDRPDSEEVDLWLDVPASPRSMGWGDSFRVPNAYRVNGSWLHRNPVEEEEIYAPYITHWMPTPQPPEIDHPNYSGVDAIGARLLKEELKKAGLA